MSDWSGVDPNRTSAGTGVTVPMDVLSSLETQPATALGPESGSPDGVVFRVYDALRGEVSIIHGSHEVVVRDPQLVARIRNAARSTRQAR